ncbi:transposase-like zinc-binding domain-containing protein [Haemophilus parahaemolyticus]
MKNEQKNCPYCSNSTIQKHGKKNNLQRYFCTTSVFWQLPIIR